MKYDHMVKANGKYYAAGEDVPDIDMAEDENPLPFSDDDITLETQTETEEKAYTKTEINTMKTAELQQLATSVGIEDAYAKSGSELKGILAEHFGL